MAGRINELRARLNPIIAAGVTARGQELIDSVRKITDGAISAGAYGGSRMALGLEAEYRKELSNRAALTWETLINAIDGFRPYDPMELSDDIKHFINEHLESSRAELAHDLKQRSGKQSQENETFNRRFEMREHCEEQLRLYGAKIDLWAKQKQVELSEDSRKQLHGWLRMAFEWIWRLFKLSS